MIAGNKTCAGRSKGKNIYIGRKHLERMKGKAGVPCFQKEKSRQCWDAGCKISAQPLTKKTINHRQSFLRGSCHTVLYLPKHDGTLYSSSTFPCYNTFIYSFISYQDKWTKRGWLCPHLGFSPTHWPEKGMHLDTQSPERCSKVRIGKEPWTQQNQ